MAMRGGANLYGHPAQSHPAQGHPAQGHALQGHAPQGHAPQGHAPQGHAPQGHAPQGHPLQSQPAHAHLHSNMTHPNNIRVQSGHQMQSREPDEPIPESGRVGDVVRRFRVFEDGIVASRLQNQEITQHFEKNRSNRKIVREDIPVAKQMYTEEESRAQYERMRQLEEQKRVAERDAQLARDLQKQLSTNQQPGGFYSSNQNQPNYRQQPNQNAENYQPVRQPTNQTAQAVQARYQRQSPDPVVDDYHVLERGHVRPSRTLNNPGTPNTHDSAERRPPDYNVALNAPRVTVGGDGEPDSQLHEDLYNSDIDEERLEAEDRELALRLQREEEERYERKKQQRSLAKERRRLEQMIEQTNRVADPQSSNQGDVVSGRAGPGDDFSDLYIPPDPNMTSDECRRLQEEQDAEIARLIQENESRGIRGGRDAALLARLKQIEQQDSQLARIIQDEENLRAQRRQLKQKQKVLQQQREVAERLAVNDQSSSESNAANRSHDQPVNQSQPSTRPTHEQNRQELSSHTDSLTIQTDIPTSNNTGIETRRVNKYPERSEHRASRLPDDASEHRANKPPDNVSEHRATRPPDNLSEHRATRPPDNLSEHRATRPPDNLYAQHQKSGERRVPVVQSRSRHESFTDDSPTGPPPDLPERRYKDENIPDNHPRSHMYNPQPMLQAQQPLQQPVQQPVQQPPQHVGHHNQSSHNNHNFTHGGDVRSRSARSHVDENQNQPSEQDHRALARLKDMPPYRAQRPPPYKNSGSQHAAQSGEMNHQPHRHQPITPNSRNTESSHHHKEYNHNYRTSEQFPSTGPSSQVVGHTNQPQHIHRHDLPEDNSHYELPWNLEHQIMGSQGEQIVPKQVSPPAGRQPARHAQAEGEYIQTTESGHLVMNIAEVIDPTYEHRGGAPPRRTSHTQHAGALDAGSEFTAIAGQRRTNGRSHRGGKRESCKQQ